MITKHGPKDAPDAVAAELRAAGLRATAQRVAVLARLKAGRGHSSAEGLRDALLEGLPSLSLTTVYNVLDELRAAGLAHAITISEEERLWDAGTGNHHHFLCRSCGEISDIDVPCPYLKGMVGRLGRVDEIHGYFKGACNSCIAREKKRKVK